MSAVPCFAVSWPSPLLSPESKAAAGRKAAEAAKARRAGYAGIRRWAPLAGTVTGQGLALYLIFIPPNLRRHSVAKLIERFSPTLEGMADYLGMAPELLSVSARLSRSPVPGGQVLVKLKPL